MSHFQVTIGRRIGLYRFCGDIGRGNFSKVKLAVHQLTRGRWGFKSEREREVKRGKSVWIRESVEVEVGGYSLILVNMRIEIDTLLPPPADKVAIKVVDLDRAGLDAKALRMLSSEIATLECVHHPNILR